MSQGLVVASVMVAEHPKFLGGRYFLSCCDSVWAPVDELPYDLVPYFTGELGAAGERYGGFLQLINPDALPLMRRKGLFVCFRAVLAEHLPLVQVEIPDGIYESLMPSLTLVGWDVASGNGWLSASCHGCFPINPFTGVASGDSGKLNRYGLFSDISDCYKCCAENNIEVPEHAPWYPVAIFLTKDAAEQLLVTVG